VFNQTEEMVWDWNSLVRTLQSHGGDKKCDVIILSNFFPGGNNENHPELLVTLVNKNRNPDMRMIRPRGSKSEPHFCDVQN
jgi:hypothetical protein